MPFHLSIWAGRRVSFHFGVIVLARHDQSVTEQATEARRKQVSNIWDVHEYHVEWGWINVGECETTVNDTSLKTLNERFVNSRHVLSQTCSASWSQTTQWSHLIYNEWKKSSTSEDWAHSICEKKRKKNVQWIPLNLRAYSQTKWSR